MSLIQKPIFWVGVVGLAAVGWIATAPEQPTSKTGNAAKLTRKKTTPKKGVIQFEEADFKADFKPLNIELKNAFVPVVARKQGGFGGADGLANAIPLDFTAGESGWVYTGNAEIDGVANALLENRSTGEGVFLRVGERWKSAAVSKILTDAVVMKGPSGVKTFSLVNEESPRMARSGFAPAGVNVPSGLQGAIGRGRNSQNGFANGQALQVLPTPQPGGGVMTIPSDGGMPDMVFTPMD